MKNNRPNSWLSVNLPPTIKKVLIGVLLIGVIGLGLGYSMYRKGIQEIKEKTFSIVPEVVEQFATHYQTTGTVIPTNISTIHAPTNITRWHVQEGQWVEPGTNLGMYYEGEEEKQLLSNRGGVVLSMDAMSIQIGDGSNLEIEFQLPSEWKNKVKKGDEIHVGEIATTISFVSELVSESDFVENYAMKAGLPKGSGYHVGNHVVVSIDTSESKEVWKIPLSCVVKDKGLDYVIYSSWLDHITSLTHSDYASITIVGSEDGYYLIEPLERNSILQLSELANQYVSELIAS